MPDHPELGKWELWVLQVYFQRNGLFRAHDLLSVERKLQALAYDHPEEVLQALLDKKVLSLSPDGRKLRLTDYGVELYRAMTSAQEDWESQPIIAMPALDREEVVIRAGETFKANRVLRELLTRPLTELCVLDPYLGPMLFDLAEKFARRGQLRLITSDKAERSLVVAYQAFRDQYPNAEMRLLSRARIHDRFILWDGAHGYHLGHSIKDMGKKDTQVNLLKTPQVQYQRKRSNNGVVPLDSYLK